MEKRFQFTGPLGDVGQLLLRWDPGDPTSQAFAQVQRVPPAEQGGEPVDVSACEFPQCNALQLGVDHHLESALAGRAVFYFGDDDVLVQFQQGAFLIQLQTAGRTAGLDDPEQTTKGAA